MIDTRELPESLSEAVTSVWTSILEGASAGERAQLEALGADNNLDLEHQQLARVLACSRYVADTIRRRPWLLLQMLASGVIQRPLREGELHTELGDALSAGEEEAGVVLRRFRQRHILRIIWRDLNRLSPTLETTRDMSWLAEACIEHALAIAMRDTSARFGKPLSDTMGDEQELVVLAMGKLGAWELNLSSDVDLIFCYPQGGSTHGGERSLGNEEFFTRVGRQLIALLDPQTAEGFVFRMDMRLRPYGDSGALVHSFAALESYYQEQGRDWERYALVKARPITGSGRNRRALMRCLRPFVYRGYVDYSAIESLRAMKQLIVTEVRRRGLQGNVKLGSGGIREIEFIAQCFQLIRGGRDRSLQQRGLMPVLYECAGLGCLPEPVVEQLQAAYLFLRDVEHALQAWDDRQTQELPGDTLQQQALAHCLGFPDYPAFLGALDGHRAAVSEHFANLIAGSDNQQEKHPQSAAWSAQCDAALLSQLGFKNSENIADKITALFKSRRVQTLQAEGRERLDRFMPLLLESCAESEHPDLSIMRALPLVSAVLRRSAYLLLLIENPPARADLAALCAASPWIGEQLATRPALLDELLDRASLYSAPERSALQDELRQQLTRLAVDDLEGYMDALRYFKASQVLRVAASELSGRLPLMQVSDKLSFIAEVCLEQVLTVAWAQLAARHGEPARDSKSSGFVVLAYGKLGGIELSYASDLDLVFVYDAVSSGVTDGERSIDNATFYTRLGQRIIHILETRMGLGQLYEVDMRLRPSGASGMLVSSFTAFEHYQREDAWTWEHQALVRVRTVAGDAGLAERVLALRRDVLCQKRVVTDLAGEVVSMREKMRAQVETQHDDGELDLKQGVGAIVDIEFMVQYAVLAWASEDPSLADWSDNVRVLETLAATGRLSQAQCGDLIEAYLDLRSANHQLALQQQPGRVPAQRYALHSEKVRNCWEQLFSGVQAAT
ncbi:MAG: bifunctional [glutamate--ammonia ligase]-adenylyl-L-tyrosine phosphorylase/[glutamate--ammonia-ligase] adenylyltransferase [Congregibacter sp.]